MREKIEKLFDVELTSSTIFGETFVFHFVYKNGELCVLAPKRIGPKCKKKRSLKTQINDMLRKIRGAQNQIENEGYRAPQ